MRTIGVVTGARSDYGIYLPVLKAIQEASPGGQIANITKQMWGNRALYIISFKEESRFPKIYVTGEGTVLKDAPR